MWSHLSNYVWSLDGVVGMVFALLFQWTVQVHRRCRPPSLGLRD